MAGRLGHNACSDSARVRPKARPSPAYLITHESSVPPNQECASEPPSRLGFAAALVTTTVQVRDQHPTLHRLQLEVYVLAYFAYMCTPHFADETHSNWNWRPAASTSVFATRLS